MCQIQHLNLGIPRFEEDLLLLVIYEEVTLGIFRVLPVQICGQGLWLLGFQYRRHKKSSFWSTLIYSELGDALRKAAELLEGREDF